MLEFLNSAIGIGATFLGGPGIGMIVAGIKWFARSAMQRGQDRRDQMERDKVRAHEIALRKLTLKEIKEQKQAEKAFPTSLF